MSFYKTIYKLFSPLVRGLYRIRTAGTENIPASGAVLAANHTAFSDVLVISAAAGRQVRYMAKKELFRTPLGPLIRALGAYPVDRGGADTASIRQTVRLVEDGELVGIFPQGHRYGKQDPRGTEVRGGVGLVAWHTKASVVPVLVANKRMKTGIFHRNTVTFGTPVTFEELLFERGGSAEYLTASRIIFDKICSMYDERAGGEKKS